LKAKIESDTTKNTKKRKSVLILCLDKSGSMLGQPIQAVKKGAVEVAKRYTETEVFDKLITIAFDNNCRVYECENLVDYEENSNSLRAGGGTSFSAVFEEIYDQYKLKGCEEYEDCTVMFMTDGQTNSATALQSLDRLKALFQNKTITYRFLCIGFSQFHDADLLGTIARSGKEMGNFIYIREDSENFEEEIRNALKEAFWLAPGPNSLNAWLRVEGKEEFEVKIKMEKAKDRENEYKEKIILPLEILEKGNLKLHFEFGELEVEQILGEDKEDEEMSKLMYFYNSKIYEWITKAQLETDKQAIELIFNEAKEIDESLNEAYIKGLKIKKKDERKAALEPIHAIKQKI